MVPISWGPLHHSELTRSIDQTTLLQDTTKNMPYETNYDDAYEAVIMRVEKITKKGWKKNEVALAWVDTKVRSLIVSYSMMCLR